MAAKRGRGSLNSLSRKAWLWLGRELDAWAESGGRADFWWRDDDAIESTGELHRLLDLGNQFETPLALAVIPAKLDPELSGLIQNRPLVTILQHGFAHQNHAATGQLKLELGGGRAKSSILADLEKGYRILEQHFDDRFEPVLVPPWNRIDTGLLPALPDLGFVGISSTRVRHHASPAPRLLQVNTHLDPINWRHRGGFIGVYPSIAILVQHLQARRFGYRDLEEPTGILTHHLVQNAAVWRFLEDLLHFLTRHPAATWQDTSTLWQ